jgi:hypothetical protein
LHRIGATVGDNRTLISVARAAGCSPTSIIKGFVSESEALRELKNEKKEAICGKPSAKILAKPRLQRDNAMEHLHDSFASLVCNQTTDQKVRV